MKTMMALAIVLACVSAQAEESHCSSREISLFNCGAGKKVVSVCASNPLGAKTGFVEYRFGKTGQPEMVVPLPQSRDRLDAGTFLTANGGTGGFLRFRKNDYGYVVYWSTTRGEWNKDGTRGWVYAAGVVAEQKGKKLANVKCSRQASSEDDRIDPAILYQRLGFPKNEEMEGFDFP